MIEKDSLRRTINLPTATSIVIGGVIGSGIFVRPAEMAALLDSPFLIFFIWVIAGLLNLFSAMVTAEIGAMFPETGGQYVFIRKIYGDFWAFIYGWAAFSVINTAGTAAIAFICAEYLQYFFELPRFAIGVEQSISIHLPLIGTILPLENFGLKMLTIAILGLFTWTSYRSTKLGGTIQLLSTILKLAAIAFLILGLFFSGRGELSNFIGSSTTLKPAGYALIAAMVAACTGAFQAYDGWGVMVNVAGEIRNPQKNIPNGLIIGLLTCMLVYIAVTAAIVYMLPIDAMASSKLVAADAAKKAFGFAGGGLVAILIVLSVFGTTNANVMAPPRMTFAMAHEGHFFRVAGRIHPAFKTPGNALLIHFIWMSLFVLSGSFFMLADMSVFIVWAINLMILFGIFILRKKMPDTPRPYKMGGYPVVPFLVLLFNLFYLGVTLYNDIHNYVIGKTLLMNSVLGLVITALGIPFYFYFRHRYKKRPLE
jgi:APA family basic amino acid/polyamine antiporter